MKACYFLWFTLAVSVFDLSCEAREICVSHNCQKPVKCDGISSSGICPYASQVCCISVLKEYRTLCPQYGGECTPQPCPQQLRIDHVHDCKSGTNCCVWV